MRVRAAGCLILLGALLAAGGSSAAAQTGYPPGPCTVLLTSSVAGSASVGSTIVVLLQPTCVWAANGSVTVTVNGQPVGVKVANAAGVITVQVTVLSATQLSIDDPVLVTGQCGTNTVRGVGLSTVTGGQAVVHDTTFQVVCPAAVPARASTGGIAFTGANLARMIAVALVAIVAGTLLAVAARKRRQPTTTAAAA